MICAIGDDGVAHEGQVRVETLETEELGPLRVTMCRAHRTRYAVELDPRLGEVKRALEALDAVEAVRGVETLDDHARLLIEWADRPRSHPLDGNLEAHLEAIAGPPVRVANHLRYGHGATDDELKTYGHGALHRRRHEEAAAPDWNRALDEVLGLRDVDERHLKRYREGRVQIDSLRTPRAVLERHLHESHGVDPLVERRGGVGHRSMHELVPLHREIHEGELG